MIYESLDTVKSRLQDAIRRREQGLPARDDDGNLLERALSAIEDLESKARSPWCPKDLMLSVFGYGFNGFDTWRWKP